MTKSTEDKAKSYLHAGIQALSEGKIDDAEKAFYSILEIQPEHAPSNHNLGLIRLRQKREKEAQTLLLRAAKTTPSLETLLLLAECNGKLGDHQGAINCYKPILKQFPEKIEIWIKIAQLLETTGQKREAINSYKNALKINPKETSAAIKLSWIIWRINTTDAINLLEKTLKLVKDNIEDKIRILNVLVLFKEWKNRLDKGLPPYHANSTNEILFKSAKSLLQELLESAEELLSEDKKKSFATMTKALALFALGNNKESQECFEIVSKLTQNPMANAVRFDKSFFRKIGKTTQKGLLNKLPDVENITKFDFKEPEILYMSCNKSYFELFTKPLLLSLSQKEPGAQVHIHLMDSDLEHTEKTKKFCKVISDLKIAITVERPFLPANDPYSARTYFHAIRFIRFYNHLNFYKKRLWLMDVDALFNQSPSYFFDKAKKSDIALRVRPGRLEPWNQFNACLLGVTPNKRSLNYIHYIASYISFFYLNSKLPWGIDQLAMYAVFQDLKKNNLDPSVYLLDEKILDYDYKKEGILWCSSGHTKFTALHRQNKFDESEASVYDIAFRKYYSECEKLDDLANKS